MASSEYGPYGGPCNNTPHSGNRHVAQSMSFSVDTTRRRNEEDSWVEISSQPSSSSLSSIDNEIITTGLRIQPPLRRRRATTTGTLRSSQQPHNRSTSSHDEYDESSSSDEDAARRPQGRGRISPRLQMTQDIHFPSPSSDEKDEDESRTALGTAPPAFTPQPNAFSHPPGAGLTPRNVSGRERERDSYFAPQHGYAARQRMSHPSTNRAASDAALRASLTTLLSCAQAARSLPKRSSTTVQGPGLVRAQNEMQEFRMVPESDLLGDAPPPRSAAAVTPPALAAMQSAAQTSPNVRARSSATVSSDEKEGIGKRAATSQTRRKRRAVTVQAQDTQVHQRLLESVSPTLLTWIVSAGVVVFVSVVGFGAGYAMGYESGKEEGRLLSCGKSVPVRVRRFRWGGGSGITA